MNGFGVYHGFAIGTGFTAMVTQNVAGAIVAVGFSIIAAAQDLRRMREDNESDVEDATASK